MYNKILKTIAMVFCLTVLVMLFLMPLYYQDILDKLSSNSNSFSEVNYAIPLGMPEINADRKYIPRILSALNHTDKNAARYIKSITVLDDLNQLRTICGEAFGCANTIVKNNVISNSSIYLASEKNYDPRCWAFDILLHHEIGHVVYLSKYGPAGHDDEKSEAFARNYAGKYFNSRDVDNCMNLT